MEKRIMEISRLPRDIYLGSPAMITTGFINQAKIEADTESSKMCPMISREVEAVKLFEVQKR